jgi:peptidoglycan/xylan/chitin deacetylase (PgdA/CDA1 family)
VSELQQLAAHPLITIGAHTASHPILARAPIAVQREEIVESRAELEGWLGKPVTAFAYPNGRPGADYTDDTVALVAAAGFASAFTTGGAFAERGGAPFEHPRFLMLDSVDGPELAHRLATSWPRQQGAQCRAV